MKWLVTAFEPFAGAKSNSSLIVAEKLAREDWGGRVRFAFPVPVTYAGAWDFVKAEIDKGPSVDGVLALGQAETRSRISLERAALNWIDSRVPDNSGEQPMNVPIAQGSPDVLWSPIPWTRYTGKGPVERSYSAGTFLCNWLMFRLLAWGLEHKKQAGFVHFPLLDTQTESQFANLPRISEDIAVDTGRDILTFLAGL
jgi:pyroglutamyl-peptidase